MDMFRSKKRDVDQPSLEVGVGLQKKQYGLSGSLDDLLDIGKDDEDCLGTASENTASESEEEDNDINRASKKQKAFAKISIKREKRKEKEQRKKTEKNLISMDDFLGKQTEFKMWLYEEKSKNAGEMVSPKLKAHFKQFVRLWNKKKLASKYYRCSSLPESPAPLTPKKFNFLSEEVGNETSPLLADQDNDTAEKDVPTSPFVTFGKTPPKVFRSKKFQLFGSSSKEVALLSVAPIGSPQVVQNVKENSSKEQYQVPKFGKKKHTSKDGQEMPRGATPYKVSVFPWASTDVEEVDHSDHHEICSTATPPSLCHKDNEEEEESWPPPPSDTELLGDYSKRTNDSPQVPPPPPPRLESLKKTDCVAKSPKLDGNYADPYDKLPDTQSRKRLVCSDYQDPVDCVQIVKQRTIPEDARLVLQNLSGNDEPDLSLYCKPVSEKRFSKEELEELYAKPLKRAKRNNIGSLTESLAKPEQKSEEQSDLFNEIMDHINKSSSEDTGKMASFNPDPDYQTIDECLAKTESKTFEEQKCLDGGVDETKKVTDLPHKNGDGSVQKFATISRSKKMRVMAASTEKIYETYLSLGRGANPFKSKMDIPKLPEPSAEFKSGTFTQSLKLKSKSQPDISFSEAYQTFEIDMNKDQDQGSVPQLSSFKPVENDRSAKKNFGDVKLKDSDRAKSYEDGLRYIEEPRTPIIMATPSFDSLCNVTPLSCKSFSLQSLPHKSGSYESLSADSHMSTSTSSSLSYGPDEKTGSVQSLQSDKSLSPVKEEEEFDQYLNMKNERKSIENELKITRERKCSQQTENIGVKEDIVKTNKDGTVDVNSGYEAKTKADLVPLTPGKISALKHGIDLSVYLLKPAKQEDIKEKENVPENERSSQQATDSNAGKLNQKLFDTQSRLAIKDRLSGVKTKIDQGKMTVRKEIERRHTVQTVQEITSRSEDNRIIPDAFDTRKGETVKLGKSKIYQGANGRFDGSHEPDSKRHCGDKKSGMSVDDHYLETDLDKVITDKNRKPMKKSKSHSGFETGSSTVVTEIW